MRQEESPNASTPITASLETPRLARLREDSEEYLKVMLLQESSSAYGRCSDYFHVISETDTASMDRVNENWRRKICEWSYEVVDHFGFDREVVSIALNFLDRFVAIDSDSSEDSLSRREFQLVAVTSLYLAIKLHGETDAPDGPRRKLRIGAFVELSRGLFQIETLEKMERKILAALDWRVHPPTSVRFAARLLHLLPVWPAYDRIKAHHSVLTSVFEMSRYLTELAVCASAFSFQFKPSIVAYASILCSMDSLQDSVPYDSRVKFLSKIAEVTDFFPEMKEVREARSLLMELCPSLFESQELLENTGGFTRSASIANAAGNDIPESGKTSPVGPIEETREYCSSKKKRGRPL